jgi:tRNA threonylcarbamoyl adenosine modification protein YeaZ
MRVLAFDGTAPRLTVGIADGDRVLGRWDEEASRDRGTSLDRLIDQALSEIGWDRTAVEGLALVTGPGSLTATRIGWATASGWAAAQGIPVTGWTTSEVQHRWYATRGLDGEKIVPNERDNAPAVLCVVHNRGDEFYCYDLTSPAGAIRKPSVVTIGGWQPKAAGETWLVGPGVLNYRDRWIETLAGRTRIVSPSYEIVGGDHLARWGFSNLMSGESFKLTESPLDYGLPPVFRKAS